MDLLQIVVLLAVIGFILWAVNTFVPMESRVKQIMNTVVIVAMVAWLIFWVLSLVGLAPPLVRR